MRKFSSHRRVPSGDLLGTSPNDTDASGDERFEKVQNHKDAQRKESTASICKSPTSPGSVYTSSTFAAFDGCCIDAVLLCYWDNIVGPKIKHLWGRDEPKGLWVHQSLLNEVASRTLGGEICRDMDDPHFDSKLYLLSDKDFALVSFIFGGVCKDGMAVHSLSLMVPKSGLEYYMKYHELVCSCFARYIRKYRMFLETEEDNVSTDLLSNYLNDFFQMMKSLKFHSLSTELGLHRTFFSPSVDIDEPFLRKSITSHLMTCSRTVVTGRSSDSVNRMLHTLALFLTTEERLCSRNVNSSSPLPYQPDLYLQGVLQDNLWQVNPSIGQVYLSPWPTTVIDMGTQDVKQTALCNEQPLKHYEAIKDQMTCLWQGSPMKHNSTTSVLFEFDDAETLVKNLLDELVLLPATPGVREAHVANFVRLLERKAFCLVKYLETEMRMCKGTVRPNVKKLKQDLSLTLPGDFKIVLATAEKLKPGIYGYVIGDPRHNHEELQNIYETF